jgi:hypothetical protein
MFHLAIKSPRLKNNCHQGLPCSDKWLSTNLFLVFRIPKCPKSTTKAKGVRVSDAIQTPHINKSKSSVWTTIGLGLAPETILSAATVRPIEKATATEGPTTTEAMAAAITVGSNTLVTTNAEITTITATRAKIIANEASLETETRDACSHKSDVTVTSTTTGTTTSTERPSPPRSNNSKHLPPLAFFLNNLVTHGRITTPDISNSTVPITRITTSRVRVTMPTPEATSHQLSFRALNRLTMGTSDPNHASCVIHAAIHIIHAIITASTLLCNKAPLPTTPTNIRKSRSETLPELNRCASQATASLFRPRLLSRAREASIGAKMQIILNTKSVRCSVTKAAIVS